MKIQGFTLQADRRCRQLSQVTMALGVVLLLINVTNKVSAQSGLLGKRANEGQVVPAGQFHSDGQSYQVMNASQVPTVGNRNVRIGEAIHDEHAIAQVGCQACGTGCGGACGGYSPYGASFSSYGQSFGGSNACGVPCDPYHYVIVEGLYMQRSDQDFSFSRNVTMGDYDFEWAPRVTVGSLPNCVNGYEITYMGQFDWDLGPQTIVDAGGGLSTLLGSPLPPALSAFDNMTSQTQSYEAQYWSIEANRTLVGWDVAKILVGGRYLEYDELFQFAGVNNVAENALLRSQTENQMFGAQIGLDLLYPIGVIAYSDLRLRAGAYYNRAESNVRVINDGTTLNANFDDSGELAGVFEFGSGVRYQLGEMLSVRAGTELWYIAGVASASDQLRGNLVSDFGRKVDIDDDFFVFGVSLAAELRY